MGASFHTPFNPVAPRHDPDQKWGKHKRPRQTRSGSSSSGDSDRRCSSLIASINEALMPDIIRYLKNDLIADVKDSLLPDLKEFIQSLKCGSRRSASHHSPHRISPIRPSSCRHDEDSHVSHHPEMARRSLHVDDDNTHTPHLVKDNPRRSLQIDTWTKPRERPRDRCSLQVEDFLRKDVTLSTREIGMDEEVDQVELYAEPNAPDFTEKQPQRMKKTSAHLSSPFLMLNRRLLTGQHILPMVTADNTRLVSPNFFIVLAEEFNNIFNPSTLKYNVEDWEPPSGLKWEITRAGDDESRAWWNATHGGVVRYREYMARMIYDMCHPKVIPLFQP
ncbi:hypothetical protein C2S52_017957 [Perilla frutescens var. hirtella]|nr:hypothetical protein C2S52_017957 [Perilla frutescens var. hirtella]